MAPFWHQTSTKIFSKIDLQTHKMFDRCWDRFLMRFWCQLGSILVPKIDQNSTKKFDLKKHLKNPFSKLESIYDAILVPTWLHLTFTFTFRLMSVSLELIANQACKRNSNKRKSECTKLKPWKKARQPQHVRGGGEVIYTEIQRELNTE